MASIEQANFAKTNNPEYTDFRNRPVKLTDEEYTYFRKVVEEVLSILKIEIPIFICDHEKLGKDLENALGLHWKSNDDEFISIDNYFIHECHMNVFCGGYDLNGEDLMSVLCHELAHMKYKRHNKWHAELTEKYISKVEKALFM